MTQSEIVSVLCDLHKITGFRMSLHNADFEEIAAYPALPTNFCAYVHSLPGEFQKWQLVIMYLAPFVFLTLLLDVIFAFCVKVELIFYVIVVCNSAGCFYDVFDALIAVRCEDGDRNGIWIYNFDWWNQRKNV